MNLHELLHYDNGDLVWKVDRGGTAKKNTVAGCIDPLTEYVKVGINGKRYLAHRIIWEMLKGPIPSGYEIDHVNGIRDDNRITNLRLVTRSQNNMNKGSKSKNTSGVMGVYRVGNKWMASIKKDGHSKFLGYFRLKEKAIQARREAELEYFGEYRRG